MSKKTVAVISADKRLCRLIEAELIPLGYEVEAFENIKKRAKEYYAVICDTPSDTSLLQITAEVKITIARTLSAEDRAAAAKFGDILEYPFLLDELRALMLKKNESREKKSDNQDGKFIIYSDKERTSVTLRGNSISLSDYEYRTLELLCKNSGNCVSRDELSSTLGATDGNIADVYICHLRKKLEAPFGIKIINTLRNKGYMTNYILK